MRTVECGERQRGGVSVLRDKVRVNIHHVACRCCKSHNFSFTLPSLSYGRPQPHTHIYTNTLAFYWQCTKAYTENKLNNTPHIPIIENHFTHLQLTYLVRFLQTLCIYNSAHACKKTHSMFVFAFYQGHILLFNGVLQEQGHTHVTVTNSHFT